MLQIKHWQFAKNSTLSSIALKVQGHNLSKIQDQVVSILSVWLNAFNQGVKSL